MKRIFTAIIAALALQGGAGAQTRADAALLDMRQALRSGNVTQLAALLPRVRGHALEPMAIYWHMTAQLDSASTADIRRALERMAGTYWEDRLRNDWLLHLGQQRDWATFAAELPRFRMNDDPQLRCYALLRDAVQELRPAAQVADEVQRLWLAQRNAEDSCAGTAQTLLESGDMEQGVVWLRARLAIETRRPQAATQAVGLLDPDWVPIVNAIDTDPLEYLNEKFTAFRPHTRELVTLAIIALANTDPAAAARELERSRWQTQLSQEQRSWLWGVIGKRSAQRLQDDALSHFLQGQTRFMHADHLAWKTRASLRAGAWDQVLEAIAAMDEAQQRAPVWVYWRARALRALPQPDALAAMMQARALFESIASVDNFYGQLALEELGRRVTVPTAPAPLTAQEIEAAQNHPGLQRALSAIRLGLRSEGVREWNYTINLHSPGGMNDRELLAAAHLACQSEVWDRCINTSQRTNEAQDHSQRFPMPHQAAVQGRAADVGLDPAFVFGLIRQESRFLLYARSGVGASGLMQIMPATAQWTARRIGLNDFRANQINERDTNILIGVTYLRWALDNFDGSMPLAAAAYNAGGSRARAWRNGPVLAGDIWIENIPFQETRHYVQTVLSNTTNYAALITGQPQSLRQLLGSVGPRAGSNTEDEMP